MNGWALSYRGFDPAQEGLREALCTLGNGYFATRGAGSESTAGAVHYPGTYLAGGYNRLTSEVSGRAVENEDLVNLPNWLALTFRVADGDWFDVDSQAVLDYEQTLDLQHGVLERRVTVRDAAGRQTRICERRIVSMHHPHLAALELRLTAQNWSGSLELRSAVDGRVRNTGVQRYRQLDSQHLEPLQGHAQEGEDLFLAMRTRQSRLEIAMAARTRCFLAGEALTPVVSSVQETDHVAQTFLLRLEEGQTLCVEKTVALYTSRDRAISECGLQARQAVAAADRFDALLASHSLSWTQLWRRFDIDVEERGEAGGTSCVLRLHIFHLLQTTSLHTIHLDAGVPARGWHGEAYRGHVFWDELFIFPLLNLRLPDITRSLLMYRYRRLGAARTNAANAGYAGAMYPWQSGSDGREESQRMHLNPRSGRWTTDPTYLQRHVNAAIAYNIWQYHQATRDNEFLSFYGAEMFLEIARFWASIARFNEALGRYEICGVIGPDEFQTAYPGADKPGLDNHAYTSVMAAWVLWRALELLKLLPEERGLELRERLALTDAELAHWDKVSRRLRVVFHADGLISQFEGYEALAEFDWAGYRQRYGDIHRLDRILEAEGDSPNRYKAAKQADVLMLFYLFSTEELAAVFERLGYPFEAQAIPRNVDYYAARSSHGSTLSRVVDAWVLSRSDRSHSWRLFKKALLSDVADTQGGTTPEGIHLGAMAGTVDIIQRCYTGAEMRGDVLWLNPRLPDEITGLRLSLRYRGQSLDLHMTQSTIDVCARPSNADPIQVGVRDRIHVIQAGERRRFIIGKARGGPPRRDRPVPD